MIAAREAARSPADGYTLFQAVVNNAINDALAPDPCCVLNDKLVPVTRLYTTPLVMVVHPSLPGDDEGVRGAREGEAEHAHLRFGRHRRDHADGRRAAQAHRRHPGARDSLQGDRRRAARSHRRPCQHRVPVAGGDPRHVRSGKLRGARGRRRASACAILPDVPTMAEAGCPIEGLGWNGIFVPAGTPRPIIDRLQVEIATRAAARRKCRTTRPRSAPPRAASGPRSSPPSCAARCRSGARSSRTPTSRRE